MKFKNVLAAAAFCGIGVSVIGLPQCQAQELPSETFLSTRQIGMGGTTYVDAIAEGRDDNPALLFQRGSGVFLKGSYTGDDVLPDIRMGYVQVNQQLSPNWIVEAAGTTLGGNKQLMPGVQLGVHEDDIGFQVAHRLNKRLILGFGTAFIHTNSQLSVDGLGGFRQNSHPKTFGGRAGLQYKVNDQLSLEGTYDLYTDRQTTKPYGFLGTVLPETSSEFKTKKLTLGGVYHTRYADFNLFHTDLNVDEKDGDYSFSRHFWHGGVKVPVKNFSIYGGLYDGNPSYGVGYQKSHHSLTVAASSRNQVFSDSAKWGYFAEYNYRW